MSGLTLADQVASAQPNTKSLVSKVHIPGMDVHKQKVFPPNMSLTLNERSPLNNDPPLKLDPRMPTIFQSPKNKQEEDNDSIQKINESVMSSEMNVVDDIAKLVNEGGSSAYLLYLQQ